MLNDVKQLFIYLLAICISFLFKFSAQVTIVLFVHFFNYLVAFISYIFKVLRFSRYKVILSLFHLVDVVNLFKYKVKEKKCEC